MKNNAQDKRPAPTTIGEMSERLDELVSRLNDELQTQSAFHEKLAESRERVGRILIDAMQLQLSMRLVYKTELMGQS